MLDFFIGWGVGEGFYMFYIFSNHTFIKCILGKSIKSVINIIFSLVIWVTIIMKYIVYYLFLILIFINSFNLASSNYFGLLFRFYFLLILFLFCGELVKKTGILRLTAEPLSPPPPLSPHKPVCFSLSTISTSKCTLCITPKGARSWNNGWNNGF